MGCADLRVVYLSKVILALGFSLAVPTKAQNDVDLTGGAFNDVTTIEVEGGLARVLLIEDSYGLDEYGLTEAGIRAAVPTVFERYRFD